MSSVMALILLAKIILITFRSMNPNPPLTRKPSWTTIFMPHFSIDLFIQEFQGNFQKE